MKTQENPILSPSVTLAIHPFLNIGSSNDERFLSEGVSRVIADSLCGLQGLNVISVNSSYGSPNHSDN